MGRAQESYRLLRAARDLVSPERDPLWASMLTRWVAATAFGLGETSGVTEAVRRAVELSSVDPDSGEHAEALAHLSYSVWWDGRTEEARLLVEDAVAAAHRSGSASAIARAHGIRAHLQLMDTNLEQADLDCQVCWEHAQASGDPEDISTAYQHRLALAWTRGDLRRLLEHARDCYAWSAGLGQTVYPATWLAFVLLAVGDLSEAEGLVRAGLAASGNPIDDVNIRLHAATLAVRRGANDAARDHLLRARELFPDLEEQPEGMAGSGHGRSVAGPERPSRGVRARRTSAARATPLTRAYSTS